MLPEEAEYWAYWDSFEEWLKEQGVDLEDG